MTIAGNAEFMVLINGDKAAIQRIVELADRHAALAVNAMCEMCAQTAEGFSDGYDIPHGAVDAIRQLAENERRAVESALSSDPSTLVQRLRDYYTEDDDRYTIDHPICDEAADEIERLQAELMEFKAKMRETGK